VKSSTAQDRQRVARVIRAARKLAGKTQSGVASHVGITQANFSKIESGLHLPTVDVWYGLCDHLGITNPDDAYKDGFIDHCSFSVPKDNYPDARFKLPAKYERHRGSKVRVARIMVDHLKKIYGEEGIEQYARSVGADPDFLTVLDYQVSVQFALDLAQIMIQKGVLLPSHLPSVAAAVTTPSVQGALIKQYGSCKSQAELLKKLIEQITAYEVNFEYRVEEETKDYLIISDRPRSIMRYFDYKNDTLGSFLCVYKKEWLRQFSTLLGAPPVDVQVLEDHYKGFSRSLYKITL
jgi:transcriptional regulator with XRE-family HTH domain